MIQSKADLQYYLLADKIASGNFSKPTIMTWVKSIIYPNYVLQFQVLLRKVEYYSNCELGFFGKIKRLYLKVVFNKLSLKLGFSIPPNVFGPGLAIAHYGTIIINSGTKIGSNCRLHACVNIGTEAGFSDRAPTIGDNCYIGPGAKIYGAINIPNGTAIGANAVVNKTLDVENAAIAGAPAIVISTCNTFNILIPATILIARGLGSDDTLTGLPARVIQDRLNN
jgi:serine O-acetyltransferase